MGLADEATILLTVTAALLPVRFLTPIRRRAAKSGTLEAWQKR